MSIAQYSQLKLTNLINQLGIAQTTPPHEREFLLRLGQYLPQLHALLADIYDFRDDLDQQLESLTETLYDAWRQRPQHLHAKDQQHIADPEWHQRSDIIGMACYVDLIAGDLSRLQQKIPYLKSLGIRYLHLMPLYKVPEGDSDGGYAVSDYRTVNPKLGTMDDLRELAVALDAAGIHLVLDFVFNHTADDHAWAQAARAGNPTYQSFYYIFDDRSIPDAYEKTLREIFPQIRRGCFTQIPTSGQWVWTTFNNFQWDLNYSNPEVFRAIVADMLFLANVGADCLRLDALAFIWKEMGTDCENQRKAHQLIRAFNACLRIAAPSVVFKSEAIVHPDHVNQYISPEECQLSYNPLLMALLWNSLATRKTRLLTESLQHRFDIHRDCTWVNYVRCHDDIGWTFDDQDAANLGINAYDHRHFLNQFYTGQHPGSFAKGEGFQFNPATGDCRVCGALASLAGLEQALERDDPKLIDMAVRRILLLHSVILSIGGIPLIYAGDELALLNDYGYRQDPQKLHDSRWVNRPAITDADIAQAQSPETIQHRVFEGLQRLLQTRCQTPVMGRGTTKILQTGNDHCFAYLRSDNNGDQLLCVCNFSDHEQRLDAQLYKHFNQTGIAQELASSIQVSVTPDCSEGIQLLPLQFLWLLMPRDPTS